MILFKANQLLKSEWELLCIKIEHGLSAARYNYLKRGVRLLYGTYKIHSSSLECLVLGECSLLERRMIIFQIYIYPIVIPYIFFLSINVLGITINIFTGFFLNLKILESAICRPSTVFDLLDRVRSVDRLPYFYWLLKIAARVCHVIPCRLCNVY